MTGGALPAPPLRGQEMADVAIVGGGYTGMWTAYFLTERDPSMRIVILEQDICGGGPSGRNGGFVHGWWEYLPTSSRNTGRRPGWRSRAAADEVVDGIGAWCAEHGVDAWYRKAGYLAAHAFPNVESGFEHSAAEVAAWAARPAGGVVPGAGPGGLRFARVSGRPVDAERGLHPAGAPGARPAPRPPRAGCGHPREHARPLAASRLGQRRPGPAEHGRHHRPGIGPGPPGGPSPSTPGRPAGPAIGSASWPGAATWSSPSPSRTGWRPWAGPAAS